MIPRKTIREERRYGKRRKNKVANIVEQIIAHDGVFFSIKKVLCLAAYAEAEAFYIMR